MQRAIEINDDFTTDLLQRGIQHLQCIMINGRRKYPSYETVADEVRVLTGRDSFTYQNIGAIMTGKPLRGFTTGLALSRLMSMEGFDEVADAASATNKRTMPTPSNLTLNGVLADEVQEIVECLGIVCVLARQGRFMQALYHAKNLLPLAYRLIAELTAMQEANGGSDPGGDGFTDMLPGLGVTAATL